MKAHVGDELFVLSSHLDHPAAEGKIIEVHGTNGDPPFLVRWDDDGRESLVFPGPDSKVVSYEHTGRH